jgi:hypothetical protein
VMETVEYRPCNHLMFLLFWQWSDGQPFGHLLVNPLMGTAVIEEGNVLVEDPPGMALAENQNMIQAFAANRTEEALTNRRYANNKIW